MNEVLTEQAILGRLMSGEAVVDRPDSHAHIGGTALETALGYVHSRGRDFLVEEVYMGEQVGLSTCVETDDDDEIIYAYRPKRFGPTRFVMNREPVPTELMTVILKRTEDIGRMVLISAWAGGKAEPEPWDRNATEASQSFWESHALVWGSEPVDGSKLIYREK